MGRSARSTEFLKECLAESFIQLLQSNEYNKITIPEICKKAGVGRMTYYRHFDSKMDLVVYKLSLIFAEWLLQVTAPNQQMTKEESANVFFQTMYKHKLFFETTHRANLQLTINNSFCQNFLQIAPKSTPLEKYSAIFFLNGLFGVLNGWLERNFAESPEEMSEYMQQIINEINADNQSNSNSAKPTEA